MLFKKSDSDRGLLNQSNVISETKKKHQIARMNASLTCCALLLAIAASATTASNISTTVRLRSERTCSQAEVNSSNAIAAASTGSPIELRELFGVSDARVCHVECAVWPQCAVASYRPGNWTCLLGNLSAWQPCAVQSLALMRTPTPPASLMSRLLGLYSFRFGLDNLVAQVAPDKALPAAYATLTAKFVYGRGVMLPGDFTSYLQVNLTGLGGGRPLSSTGRATYYARVVPDASVSTALPLTVHTVYNNSYLLDQSNHTSKWILNGFIDAISFEAHDLSPSVHQVSVAPHNLLSPAGSAHSFAVVFDPANGARFYQNGAWSAGSTTTAAATSLAHGEETLRIGYDMLFPFSGLILCYAVAADNLTLAELQQLDRVC